MSYRDLKAIVSDISKRKPVPATVIDVLGSKCAVRLSGNGGMLTDLEYGGGAPVTGQRVYVDYSRGYPFVSVSDRLARTIEPIVATNRPVSSATKSSALSSIEKKVTRYGNLIYRYEWDIETEYLANDLVSFDGSIYLCILDCIGTDPLEEANWTALGGGASMSEAPLDYNYYARRDAGWYNITAYTDTLYPTFSIMTNKSGSNRVKGDVVIVSTVEGTSFETTTTVGDTRVLGVVNATSIDNNGGGMVATNKGTLLDINCDASEVNIGEYLHSSTTAGLATSAGTSRSVGTFAVSLTYKSGGDTGSVQAVLLDCETGGSSPTTTTANDFQVGDGLGAWVKKTLAETVTILRTLLDGVYLKLSDMSAVNALDLTDGGATTLHTHAGMGAATTWTPTYTGGGSMTYTSVTTTYARYIQLGKLVFFWVRSVGTTGGTANIAITISMPIAPLNIGATVAAVATINDGVVHVGRGYVFTDGSSPNRAQIINQVAGIDAVYNLAAGVVLVLSGVYEAA